MPWNRGGNSLVEQSRSVDVRRWQRDGLLIDRHTTDEDNLTNQFSWRWLDDDGEVVASIKVIACRDVLWLKYSFSIFEDEWHQVNERIRLTHTAMNFGGERVWFQCPNCNRRCAKIYILGQPNCRTCKRLTYGCQVEKRWEQHHRQARKIEDLIESRGGTADCGEIKSKPPRMHWSTFNRLVDQHHHHCHQSHNALLETL